MKALSTAGLALALLAGGCRGVISSAGPSGRGSGGGEVSAGAAGTSTASAGSAGAPVVTAGTGGGAGAPACEARVAPIRRLTRSQVASSLVEAFAGKVVIDQTLLPVDERVQNFASNQTLSVTSQGVQAYQAAAEAAAAVALKTDGALACDRKGLGDEGCARALFERLAPSFLRRAPTDDERARWLKAYTKAATGGTYEAGLQAALTRLLQSPSFLYVIESLDQKQSGTVALTDLTLASRLSLLLWNGPPDATLLTAAQAGKLHDEASLTQQVDRMLDDDRSSRFVRQFAVEWMNVDGIDQGSIDPGRLGTFTPAVLTEMKTGAGRFVDEVLRRQGGSMNTLLAADFSYPEGSEAQIYGPGTPGPGGSTTWAAGQRSGLLTLPAVLYRTAHSTQTSPVLRGKWVRETFFCTTPPSPPPSVMAVAPEVTPGSSTRDRFAMHRADPSCAGCHELMDDVGLTFEHYDPLGRYRTTDGGKPVDSTGDLSSTDVNGPLTGVADLAKKLGASGQVQACFAKQLFRYAEGRTERSEDACVLGAMQQGLGGPTPLRGALKAYVQSPGFRLRSVP